MAPPINPNLINYDRPSGNRPIEDEQSRAIAAARDAALAEKAKLYKGQQKVKRTKWVKMGLQPAATGGFNLIIENWDGDKKIKTTIKKNLGAFAAREQLALHMAAMYEGF